MRIKIYITLYSNIMTEYRIANRTIVTNNQHVSNRQNKINREENNSFILKYARAVDDIDMYIAPLSTLALWHENKTIQTLGIAATILDIGLVKTPFVAMYILKTGDYKSAIEWLGWEALAHAIPYEGGLLSIRRNYEKSAKEYYDKKTYLKIKR
jgi:hypothetical protein